MLAPMGGRRGVLGTCVHESKGCVVLWWSLHSRTALAVFVGLAGFVSASHFLRRAEGVHSHTATQPHGHVHVDAAYCVCRQGCACPASRGRCVDDGAHWRSPGARGAHSAGGWCWCWGGKRSGVRRKQHYRRFRKSSACSAALSCCSAASPGTLIVPATPRRSQPSWPNCGRYTLLPRQSPSSVAIRFGEEEGARAASLQIIRRVVLFRGEVGGCIRNGGVAGRRRSGPS